MPKTKKEAPVQEPAVVEKSLEDILADRFGRYSKYIIQERALPDARDGLKPVQRRILFAMMQDGNTWNKPYRKSAKAVGNVIGNYHPHGDSSVYDAMVRLSQFWKIRLPLIDMQGNNGSIDDDPAAAMRYTEARLSKIAGLLLEDIDADTVAWTPNFSDEIMEPVVLPARYPNLLTHGISGIAAGYATYIPPHNLNEVIDGTIYRIEHPECTLDDMMQIIKGPDFPTGGIIMSREGIRQAFETGKGKVLVRGKATIEEGRTINQIVITEIPYEVVKSSMVKKMDEIRLNRKVDGILDVRDESDRNGLRIVIDLKKEVNASAVLNYFYKNTELQVSCNYNTVAIVRKAPKLMPLLDVLDAFIDHREEVVLRRSQFNLKNKQKRAHIVEGLIMAISVLDEVIAIIRASKNKADSRVNLMNRFGLSEEQAEAIVTLQLYRLSNTDILELKKEAAQLEKEIAFLQGIIENRKKRMKLIVKELREVNEEFVTPRLSVIQDEVDEIVIDQKAMIAEEQVMVTVTRDGYVKKVSLRSYSSSAGVPAGRKEGDVLVGYNQASTLQTLAVFTDLGHYGEIPVYKLADARWKDTGTHLSAWLKMESSEKVIAAFLKDDSVRDYRFILASRYGQIKRMNPENLSAQKGMRMQTVMLLGTEDRLVSAEPVYENDAHVALISREGFGVEYPADTIPQSSLRSRGVRGMSLGKDDTICSASIISTDCVLLAMEEGYMKRISSADLPAFGRPARGIRLFKAIKSSPAHVDSVHFVKGSDELLMGHEKLEPLKMKDVPKMAATASWSRVLPAGETPDFQNLLPVLHNGTYAEQVSEEQLSLFEEKNRKAKEAK